MPVTFGCGGGGGGGVVLGVVVLVGWDFGFSSSEHPTAIKGTVSRVAISDRREKYRSATRPTLGGAWLIF